MISYFDYTKAVSDYFHISRDQVRDYMNNDSPLPNPYAIAHICIDYLFIDFPVDLATWLHRDSERLYNTWRISFSQADYLDAAECLRVLGLHELQMILMRIASEFVPAPVELRL